MVHLDAVELAPPGAVWVLGLKPGEASLALTGGDAQYTRFKIMVK